MKQINSSCVIKLIKRDCVRVFNQIIKFFNLIWGLFFVLIWFMIPVCYFAWMFIVKSYDTACFIELIVLFSLAFITSLLGLVLREEWNVIKRRYPDDPLMDTFLCFIVFAMLLIISTVIFAFDAYWMFIVIGVLMIVSYYGYSLYTRCITND